ncbi:MAG: hypothetical protein RR433_11130, partial [Gordonibacter sp.]
MAMPIAWDELDQVAPGDIRMADALARMADDNPWSGFSGSNRHSRKRMRQSGRADFPTAKPQHKAM